MEFNTIIETSRGCPNRCAYCDWGLLKEKTRFFPLDKVFAEIEWMGRNKIRFVWGADANFGISADDLLIADAFVNTKEKYGYPERVRINYSKSNRERVLEIVRRFNRKGIDRAGATISLQSLSPVVLENIGRKNMSLEHFQKDFGVYHEENLQVYSELILGLPGETYDSFADGICKLFEIGQHFIFEVYNCIVLPNSILGQAEYMKKFGIKTSNSEIVRYHCAADAYYIPEKTNIITETDSMPCNMWQKSAAFGGFTQAMHGCGLLRCFAIYAYYELQKSYRSFYEGLTEYIENGNAPFTSGVFKTVKDYFASLAQGENPRLTVPFAGNLVWENYEYIFLNLCGNLDLFYEEMMPYLSSVIEDGNILSQLRGILIIDKLDLICAEHADLLSSSRHGTRSAGYGSRCIFNFIIHVINPPYKFSKTGCCLKTADRRPTSAPRSGVRLHRRARRRTEPRKHRGYSRPEAHRPRSYCRRTLRRQRPPRWRNGSDRSDPATCASGSSRSRKEKNPCGSSAR
jgi:hypothetical protein